MNPNTGNNSSRSTHLKGPLPGCAASANIKVNPSPVTERVRARLQPQESPPNHDFVHQYDDNYVTGMICGV